jgi:hypothetical protein
VGCFNQLSASASSPLGNYNSKVDRLGQDHLKKSKFVPCPPNVYAIDYAVRSPFVL